MCSSHRPPKETREEKTQRNLAERGAARVEGMSGGTASIRADTTVPGCHWPLPEWSAG